MDTQQLFAAIDRLQPEYLTFWKNICSMETRSDDFEALNRQSDFIESFAKAHGLRTERTSYPAAGDTLILCLDGDASLAPAALLAHMDTVHRKGAFGPVPVTEKDGILYGPGVCDCKGGIAVGLLAMEAIRSLGLPHRPFRFLLDSDEESGEHLGMEARSSFHIDGSRGCIAAFNCETGKPGAMTVGRKGVLRIAVDITGKPGHAGNAYFESASAVREAAYKILEIEKYSVPGGMTLNVGKITGGTVVNIVPETCHFEIDIRFLTDAMCEEAIRLVRRITETSYVDGTHSAMTVLHKLPAMEETDANHKLFDKIAAFARETGLEDLVPMVKGGGSDSAFTVSAGIPTVCSMGAVGMEEHTAGEYACIDSLARRAKILAGALLAV